MEDHRASTETLLELLSNKTKIPISQLKFITEAQAQVVECRRILKWTYAYGYYNFQDDQDKTSQAQKRFFEFLQVVLLPPSIFDNFAL